VCDSYGGTFTAVNGPDLVWTCTDLPTLTGAAFTERHGDLHDACIADGGADTAVSTDPPQSVICLTNPL
jgi:hypothetical protein